MSGTDYFVRLHPQLHRLAKRILGRSSPDVTMQTTALIQEAFVRLGGRDPEGFSDERHFINSVAVAMRCALVDESRRRSVREKAEDRTRAPIEDIADRFEERIGSLIDLDEALDRLERQDPRLAEVALLRLFSGLEIAEIAELLGRGHRTVERDWKLARAWLSRALL